MDDDPLDYPRLVRDALVGVARNALRVAAERGLPGEHHSLRFGGSVERLTVPFAALSGFADPAAPFGLRFDAAASPSPAGEKDAGRDETGLPDRGEAGSPRTEANVVDIAAFRKP
jgi:uncharacterized protein